MSYWKDRNDWNLNPEDFPYARINAQLGLTRKAVELVLAGDVTALRLCLERLVPPCREAPVTLDLPRLELERTRPVILSFLLAEAGRGRVTSPLAVVEAVGIHRSTWVPAA
jgi:hypothetical protein